MLPSLSSQSALKYPHRTIGVSNNKFYRFNQLRSDYLSSSPSSLYINERDSILNDNGKTRYNTIYIISLLGKKEPQIEMSNVSTERYYIDIFNNTKLLYEELIQKCILHFI